MIQLRRACADEASALSALCERTFRDTYATHNTQDDMNSYVAKCFTVSAQREEILDPKRRVIVAEISGELIGYYILAENSPSNGDARVAILQPAVELTRLYLDVKHQGSRLGHTLMQHAITLARSEGFKTIWLGVWAKNERALAFYKKWLYKPIGEHVFQLGSDPQRDIILAHEL
jgi:ribosomal protein S18 acetylase RimI-like enzyme